MLDEFLSGLNPCSTLLSRGTATVLGREVPAALVRNLYGQEIVWGEFSCHRGKFKGKLANNANTDEVVYASRNNNDS